VLRIRRAGIRDAEAVALQTREAAREDGDFNPGFTIEQIRLHAFGPSPMIEILVAEDQGKLLAHSITYRGYDLRAGQPNLVVAALYVAPEGRRKGLARMMMSAIARRGRERGCRRINITTGLQNAAAHQFYSAIGAKEQQTAAFVLAADAIEWLAAEDR
jgi:GNAT superfamily N-acetyltransferase